MTNEEIQRYIEQNCRHEDGSPAMDEQAFYEGAKWMRDQALSLGVVVGRSDQLVCDLYDDLGCAISGKNNENCVRCKYSRKAN